jgi:hypothetical protein
VKFAIAEMTFSPPLSAPVNYDAWMQTTQSLDGCIAARNIQWLYSLVSVQGDRSICVYQVPYAEAVREAYREARMSFQQIWQAELWLNQEPTSFPQGASLVIADVNYDPPITKATCKASKQQAGGCFHELNIQPISSWVSLDGTHSICLFSATSAEDVRSLYRKVGMPFEQIWKATLIQLSFNQA